MVNMVEQIYLKVKSIMDSWSEEDIYAISFFVEESGCKYKSFDNVSSFFVSYNTEADCEYAGQYDEKRWNYAFWRQNTTAILDPDHPDDLMDLLFDWYKDNGIDNIGCENYDECYDSEMHYIGKGPVGHYELLTLVSEAAKQLQEEDYIAKKFGKRLPILIHGLEYAWFDMEATKNANTHGEADIFFSAMKELGMM